MNRLYLKLTVVFLTVALCFGITPLQAVLFPKVNAVFSVEAATDSVVASGTCGEEDVQDNLTWTLTEDGTIKFDVNGSPGKSIYMENFTAGTAPWYAYRNQIKKVVIAAEDNLLASIWSIGSYAFYGCEALENVVIPDNVKTIGEGAFSDCPALKKVYTGYDEQTWSGENSSSLYYLNIDDGNDALLNADITFKVVTGDGTCGENAKWELSVDCVLTIRGSGGIELNGTSYDDAPWYSYRNYVKKVIIGEGITSIPKMAFYDCQMSELVLPASLCEIGSIAFSCPNLKTITIPDTNKTYRVKDNVLYSKDLSTLVLYPGGKNESTVTLEPSVKKIGNGAFRDNMIIKSLDFSGSSLEEIEYAGFMGCENLISVKLPDCFKYLDNCAFGWCYKLNEIVMPNVERIEGEAFRYTSLTTFHVPATLIDLSVNGYFDAFYYVDTLREFTVDPDNQYYTAQDGVLYNKEMTTLLKYPRASRMEEYTMPDSVTSFNGISSDYLKKVTLSPKITTIPGWGFNDCGNLETIELPEGLEYISYYAFQSCSKLNRVVIPDGVTALYEWTFNNCESLTDITLPDTMEHIEDAFVRCSTLKQIRLPSHLKRLTDHAFQECLCLENIVIPESVEVIGEGTFEDCINLKDIVILSDNVEIADGALERVSWYSERLTELTIYCHEGSTAQAYAQENGLAYELLDRALTYDDVFFTSTPDVYIIGNSYHECYLNDEPVTFSVSVRGTETDGKLSYQWYCVSQKDGTETKIDGPQSDTLTVSPKEAGEYFYYCEVTNSCDTAILAKESTAESERYRLAVIQPGADAVPTENAVPGYNEHRQNYNTWSSVVDSYVYEENGMFIRLEHIGGTILAEYYNSDFNPVKKLEIPMELGLFGGAYIGEKYNYLFFGDENREESNTAEVLRVVRYTKDWERVCNCSLYGANTVVPFDAGTLRADEHDGNLYVRTAHTMYTFMDGLNHQANLSLIVDTDRMQIAVANYGISNSDTGYVSHSFNQFIAFDADTARLIAADHSDDREIGLALFVYDFDGLRATSFNVVSGDPNEAMTQPQYGSFPSPTMVTFFTISGRDGDNYTGASLGGMEIGTDVYLLALSSVQQGDSKKNESRDIYVCTVDKKNLAMTETRLTYYDTDGTYSAGTPHIIAINGGEYTVLWERINTDTYQQNTEYAIINERGEVIKPVTAIDASLSDCKPIFKDNKVIWYYSNDSGVTFCALDVTDYSISVQHTSKSVGLRGDVNGDGQVLANDARLALRASAKLETLEGDAAIAADVDQDGNILANDARQILRFSAHLITEFAVKQA